MFDSRAAGVLKWGCSACKGDEFESGDSFRGERNCDGDSRPIYFEFDEDLRRCPWSVISQESLFWVNSWIDFDRWRVLPYGGESLMSYPAYVHEAFSICENERTLTKNEAIEREDKRRKSEEQRAKNNSRSRSNG